ncbi:MULTISPECIES: hypothetical protein [Serratia]|uniref:hypothetical protein n=1 Tax=Serratia TaxID=613 RepID=UPI001013C807|nr:MULTISPECIES: hypothetical protein [Serratia]
MRTGLSAHLTGQRADGQRRGTGCIGMAQVSHGGLMKSGCRLIMNILHYAVNLQQLDNIVIHDALGQMSLANK